MKLVLKHAHKGPGFTRAKRVAGSPTALLLLVTLVSMTSDW